MTVFVNTWLRFQSPATEALPSLVEASLSIGWTLDSRSECHSWACGTEISDGAGPDVVVWDWVEWSTFERPSRLASLYDAIKRNGQGGVRLFQPSASLRLVVHRGCTFDLGINWELDLVAVSREPIVPDLEQINLWLDAILESAKLTPLSIEWDYGKDFR